MWLIAARKDGASSVGQSVQNGEFDFRAAICGMFVPANTDLCQPKLATIAYLDTLTGKNPHFLAALVLFRNLVTLFRTPWAT